MNAMHKFRQITNTYTESRERNHTLRRLERLREFCRAVDVVEGFFPAVEKIDADGVRMAGAITYSRIPLGDDPHHVYNSGRRFACQEVQDAIWLIQRLSSEGLVPHNIAEMLLDAAILDVHKQAEGEQAQHEASHEPLRRVCTAIDGLSDNCRMSYNQPDIPREITASQMRTLRKQLAELPPPPPETVYEMSDGLIVLYPRLITLVMRPDLFALYYGDDGATESLHITVIADTIKRLLEAAAKPDGTPTVAALNEMLALRTNTEVEW